MTMGISVSMTLKASMVRVPLVAAGDAAEDVMSTVFDMLVAEQQIHGLHDLLGFRAAADVEKVGRLARELDQVHGGHGSPAPLTMHPMSSS
jgi:hypothetical protein